MGLGKEYYSFHQKEQMPLSSLKLTKNLEHIELEGFRVAENTAVKDEKKTVTLGRYLGYFLYHRDISYERN